MDFCEEWRFFSAFEFKVSQTGDGQSTHEISLKAKAVLYSSLQKLLGRGKVIASSEISLRDKIFIQCKQIMHW